MGVLFGVKTTVEIMQRHSSWMMTGYLDSGTLAALNAVLTPPALLQLFKNNLVIHAVDVAPRTQENEKMSQVGSIGSTVRMTMIKMSAFSETIMTQKYSHEKSRRAKKKIGTTSLIVFQSMS